MEYSIDHVLAMVFGGFAPTDDPYVLDQLRMWIKAKWNIELTLDDLRGRSPQQLRQQLLEYQTDYLVSGKLEKDVDAIIAAAGDDRAKAAELFNNRFFTRLSADDLQGDMADVDPQTGEVKGGVKAEAKLGRDRDGDGDVDLRDLLLSRAKGVLRRELTDLEQAVLIQIFDQAWKDHLYAMDMLKGGIGLQAFAERDPRIAYKREGYKFFEQMLAGIHDKVTDIIFKVRLGGDQQPQARSAYQVTAATHAEVEGYGVEAPPAEQQATGGGAEAATVVQPIIREAPKVGRNDPCPCGSGKKFKKCCGVHAE